jgi:uncharacterized protein (DUF983 family)
VSDGYQPPVPVLTAALFCRCPRCGQGKLYDGLLSVAASCARCGLDLRAQDAGDGPAAFVVLILGAISVALAILIEAKFEPPAWIHLVLWPPFVIGGGILLMRHLKAGMIALQYHHRSLDTSPEA